MKMTQRLIGGIAAAVGGIASLVCLTLVAGATAEELAPRVNPGDTIAVFGDSISTGNGYGHHAVRLLNEAHPAWKLSFVSCGYSGWTAKGAATVVDKVLEKKPDVVTIMFGTNDLGLDGHRGAGEFKERMRSLVTPLKKAGVRVILLTTPYCGGTGPVAMEWQDRCLPFMGDAVIALAQEEGLPVFDMFTAMRQLTEAGQKTDAAFTLFQADNCHPSAEGQKLMGRALADFLEGRPSPSRPPFVLNVERPEATAGRVAKPLDVAAADASAWPAASTPMILDRPEQIVTKPGVPVAWKGPADLSARGLAAWDDEALHLRVEVTDPVVVVGAKQPAWGYDSVELFFDTRPLESREVGSVSGSFQMLVPVTGADGPVEAACGKGDAFDPATVKAFCRRTPQGYVITASVPWTSLGFTPRPESNIGYDFTVINRNAAAASRDKDYYGLWRANGNDYLDAGCLGILTLAEKR